MTRRIRGFSLIEILVAVALMGMLLMGLNTFMFSMGEIWGKGGEQRLFDQHVRAVTRHVEKLLRSAARSPDLAGGPPAAFREIRGATGLGNTLLAFDRKAIDC
jgi:prepilin-type N-terminal cleavage/methylation domain-containing protein